MEQQNPLRPEASSISSTSHGSTGTFAPGSLLIYGLHGKCLLVGVEVRQLNGESIPFYKLEIQRSTLSRSTRVEPAIWVPVANAIERGLRSPTTATESEAVFKVLASREYYFQASEPWSSVQPHLEAAIRREGAIGLAKVLSYLFVLKRKQLVPSSDITRFMETVQKLLFRELSEATGEAIRNLEDRIARSLKHKLVPDV
jgi:RNA polymerase-interacting CarD/CdnL/TRCF family regulator